MLISDTPCAWVCAATAMSSRPWQRSDRRRGGKLRAGLKLSPAQTAKLLDTGAHLRESGGHRDGIAPGDRPFQRSTATMPCHDIDLGAALGGVFLQDVYGRVLTAASEDLNARGRLGMPIFLKTTGIKPDPKAKLYPFVFMFDLLRCAFDVPKAASEIYGGGLQLRASRPSLPCGQRSDRFLRDDGRKLRRIIRHHDERRHHEDDRREIVVQRKSPLWAAHRPP